MDIKEVCIIGAGTMGIGICQVFIQAGIEVVLNDLNQNIINSSINIIDDNLEKLIMKNMITEIEKKNIISKIKGIADLKEAVKNVDFIIEAATENMRVKKEIFRKLNYKFKKDIIMATNTSSLSIDKIAAAVKNQERFIGVHFFNPAPIMQLVEIIYGSKTSNSTISIVQNLIKKIGKISVLIKDCPGFIVNRMLITMINEASILLETGIASKEDIDKSMELGANHPIGPLKLADLIGLDICLDIMKTFEKKFSSSKYKPSSLLVRMVEEGLLGRKSGEGFYKY